MTSPPGIETSMTELSVYTLPDGRRDCTMRLLLRICRRMGPLGETKGAPLMKNSVPFYRSWSGILHTVYGAYAVFVCVQAGGVTYEGEV